MELIRIRRRAMATTFEIALPSGTPQAIEAGSDALDLIDELEAQLTVYRDDSEVSRLNATAADGPVVVADNLFALLQAAAGLTRDTDGAFDCATGALVEAWGFRIRQGQVPPPETLAAARQASGFRHVILDTEAQTVRYRRAGLAINLGGIGKGYALDRAAERLWQRWGIGSALLHAGGSSVRAVGAPPGLPRGWAIAVTHPHAEGRTLGTVWLRDQGFGTSAATFQHFTGPDGKRYGHLLDPRTGVPAEGDGVGELCRSDGRRRGRPLNGVLRPRGRRGRRLLSEPAGAGRRCLTGCGDGSRASRRRPGVVRSAGIACPPPNPSLPCPNCPRSRCRTSRRNSSTPGCSAAWCR